MRHARFLLLLLLPGAAGAEEYSRSEFQAVYLHGQIDSGLSRQDRALAGRFAPKRPHQGIGLSMVSNSSRISGLKVEASWLTDENTIRSPTGRFTYRQQPLWLLAGTQLKDNRPSPGLKPFAHLLGGTARFRTATAGADLEACAATLQTTACPARFDSRRWSKVFVVGGGLDWKLDGGTAIRLVQVDYAPLQRYGQTLHSIRVGTGFVFREKGKLRRP